MNRRKNQNNGVVFSPVKSTFGFGFFFSLDIPISEILWPNCFTSVPLLLQPGFTGAWGWACVWGLSSLCWALCCCGCTRLEQGSFKLPGVYLQGYSVPEVWRYVKQCVQSLAFLSKSLCSALIIELLVLLPDILSYQGDRTGFPWELSMACLLLKSD